jgi:hypothetical protein
MTLIGSGFTKHDQTQTCPIYGSVREKVGADHYLVTVYVNYPNKTFSMGEEKVVPASFFIDCRLFRDANTAASSLEHD